MNPEGPRPPGNPTRLLAIRGDFGWEMIGTRLKLEIVGDTWRYPMFHDVSISSGQCFWQGCMQKLVDYAISFPSLWIQMMLLLFLSRTVVKSSWHIDSKIFLTFAVSLFEEASWTSQGFCYHQTGSSTSWSKVFTEAKKLTWYMMPKDLHIWHWFTVYVRSFSEAYIYK
jgi:hypothetical protein